MNKNDSLLLLYQDIAQMPQTPEVEAIQQKILA
jgi:hypothetical protein